MSESNPLGRSTMSKCLELKMKHKSPYKDFAGNELFEGDYIIHPDGNRGRVIALANKQCDADKWRVDYEDGSSLARLCLQVGDKGQAVLAN